MEDMTFFPIAMNGFSMKRYERYPTEYEQISTNEIIIVSHSKCFML